MGDETNERLARLERNVAEIRETQAVMVATQVDIKAMLGQLLPMLIKLAGDVGEIKGRMADMPTARDFGRLEGRVNEMSERLPTTIGYTPPRSAAG